MHYHFPHKIEWYERFEYQVIAAMLIDKKLVPRNQYCKYFLIVILYYDKVHATFYVFSVYMKSNGKYQC